MNNGTSLVTVGLPVYNGAGFLAEAIESVLMQTHKSLELVISDNASTDSTEAICRRYAEQDERVRYYRAEENRGASWNYNRTLELANGEYFRWLAHDDMLAPQLVEKSVAVLQSRQDVVLCFTWFVDIDERGNALESKRSTLLYDADTPSQRFRSIADMHFTCEEVFGMMRTAELRKTRMIANHADSDRTLLVELGLRGPFYEIPEELFFHRQHSSRFIHQFRYQHARAVWFDTSKEGKLVFPQWRQMGELFRVITRTPLPVSERIRCYGLMLPWTYRMRTGLRRNITWAIRHLI